MKIKIKDINDAKKICFSIEIVKKSDIVIDKVLNKIFENNVDITQECIDIMNEYTIEDIAVDAPYKGGMVMAKILQNKADSKCLKFLNGLVDNITLE